MPARFGFGFRIKSFGVSNIKHQNQHYIGFSQLHQRVHSNMNDWKANRDSNIQQFLDKLLAMSNEEWASRWSEAKTTTIQNIPTLEKDSTDLAGKVSLFKGDITTLGVDAIVNAANEALLGGGGVDGAIHRAAGRDLVRECKTLNGAEPGEAKITAGYDLPAKFVIHTVGPRGEKPEVLEKAYKNSLNLLIENPFQKSLRSVAFPCISTGIFGYPNENACRVALQTAKDFLEEHPDKVDRVIFCVFLDKDEKIYKEEMKKFFSPNASNKL